MQINNVSQTNYNFCISKKTDCGQKVEAGKATNTEKDTVELSGSKPLKAALSIKMSDIFGFDPKDIASIGIDGLFGYGMESLKALNDKLQQLMSERKIDTDIPVDLRSEYGTGDVIVSSDHPDKEKIEDLFKDNFDLRNEFTKINNALQLVQNAKDALAFQAAYNQNPQQAVSQYSWLFNSHLESTVKISNSEPAIFFERMLNV